MSTRAEELEAVLRRTLEGIRLTREYVGEHVLPPVEGWEWFDSVTSICKVLDEPIPAWALTRPVVA